MVRWLRQIRLLVWKNFILQIRRPVGTVFEVLLPIAFAALLIVAKVTLNTGTKTKCFSTFKPKATFDYYSYRNKDRKLLFFPNNSWTYEIMKATANAMQLNATSTDSAGKLFTSEESLVTEANSDYKNFGAIVFENTASASSMPKKVAYKIRLPTQETFDDTFDGKLYSYSINWRTGSVYPDFVYPGPRQGNYPYGEYFLPLQYNIDKKIIEMQTGQRSITVANYFNQFPYPSYVVDEFLKTIQFLVPILFALAFIYTAISMIKELVAEKQAQLKESMKMMGLANWIHWLSWFIKNFAFLSLSCIFMTILLKAPKIFEHSDWSLILVFFLCYAVSMIFFAFAMSVFFSNAIMSMLFGAVVWLCTLAPYLAMSLPGNDKFAPLTVAQKAAMCLLPNSCLGIGVRVISQMEISQIGAQWSSLLDPPTVDDNFSLAGVLVMMLAQSFMWFIITWYVEAVFPGRFGVSKPFYFFLTPSYWCGRSGTKYCSVNEVYNGGTDATPMTTRAADPNVEKAPDMEVGVDIDDLQKVFYSSIGKKIAVDHLSLKMYKGQITALLGHNGAGKTTTMSMLTGLYQPTAGTATINGKSILTEMDEIRDSLGLCPQHNVLFDRLTVKEHLQLFCALKGKEGKEADLKINEMLIDIQLIDKQNEKSRTLSGGMKRKLSCAMALIGDPDIVFLDEPTSGMDPYARRATWDLLQKYTEDKTVVLTTHFMDEADYLGDRIAIMADGALRCCGSSLFLKKRYGVGYHMNLVKGPNFMDSQVQKAIEGQIPRAKMVSNIGAEMRYVLEHESSSKFKDVFQLLESQNEKLGISSFGVSITTLEEVFLKVGELGDAKHKSEEDPVEEMDSPVGQHSVTRIVGKEELLTGHALKMSQFKAMFMKRLLNSIRQKRAVITQIFLPALMVFCGLLLTNISSSQTDFPSLKMDLSMLSKSDEMTNAYLADFRNNVSASEKATWKKMAESYYKSVRVNTIDIAKDSLAIQINNLNNTVTVDGKKHILSPSDLAACCLYKDLVLNENCKTGFLSSSLRSQCREEKSFGYSNCPSCMTSSGFSPYYYDCPISIKKTNLTDPRTFYTEYVLRKSNPLLFFRKYVAGITLKESTHSYGTLSTDVTVWYSNQALHTKPAALSAANNVILASLKKDASYGIQTTNFPLPKTTKEKNRDITSGFSNFVLCVFVTIAACFISASFAPYLVIEKSSKAKHVQFVSGVDSRVYWLASFCWDYINYLVPAIIIMILFASFQLDSFQGENLGALCLVILLNGLAVLPFTYCLTFIFSSGIVAYAVIALLGLLISMALVFVTFFLRLPYSFYQNLGKSLHLIFLLIPTYALPSSVLDIGQYFLTNKQCHNKRDSKECLDLVSSPFAWEYPGIGKYILYLILESLFYLILAVLIEERFFIKRASNVFVARSADDQEDQDVIQERTRIEGMLSNEVDQQAVVIQNLTKIYPRNNMKAVDGVSVAIPRKECFGLLGVNGAGKTTTFGMLTGELGITAGTAFLDGFNIQTQLREFDALLDKLTGREMLDMFARLRGIPSHKRPEVVNSVIYQLNLGAWADKMCGNYSGGNKRKLSTAMALVGDPPIIFLDEPTSGMDPASRRFLWNTLSSLLDDDRSIVLTSHSMEECEALCTRLVIMVNGQFKCLGSIQHLKSRFGQGYTLMIKIGKKEQVVRRRSSVRRSQMNKSYHRSISSSETSPVISEAEQGDFMVTVHPGEDDASILLRSTEKVKDFVSKHLPGSLLMDDRLGMLHYQILNQELTWSYMFGLLEENADKLDIIDYSLSQTTLEQVFINFAKYQRMEEPRKKKCCCCCTC